MKDRTILLSAFIACCIHGVVLFLNPGATPPILASVVSSIEVTLAAPPAIPAADASSGTEHGQVKARQPEVEPEPAIAPVPEPESAPEPAPEVFSEPEPEPVVEETPVSETVPVLESTPDAEAVENPVVAAMVETDRVADETHVAELPGRASIETSGDAAQSSGWTESVEPALDRSPGYMLNPKPAYPRAARRRGEEGTVMLLVEVLSNGRVGRVDIEKSSGFELLDNAAVKAVRRWRFVPAKKGATSVTARVRIPVEFNLKEKR